MAALTIQDTVDLAVVPTYSNHGPIRTATFTGTVTGTLAPADAITFAPSGATGKVATWTVGTKTLTYYLLTGTPAVGDTIASGGNSVTLLATLEALGDTLANNGATHLYVNNPSGDPVVVTALAVGECSHGYLHDLAVSVAAGTRVVIGPFNRGRFNESGGLVRVVYRGSDAAADLGVAAVRMFPTT